MIINNSLMDKNRSLPHQSFPPFIQGIQCTLNDIKSLNDDVLKLVSRFLSTQELSNLAISLSKIKNVDTGTEATVIFKRANKALFFVKELYVLSCQNVGKPLRSYLKIESLINFKAPYLVDEVAAAINYRLEKSNKLLYTLPITNQQRNNNISISDTQYNVILDIIMKKKRKGETKLESIKKSYDSDIPSTTKKPTLREWKQYLSDLEEKANVLCNISDSIVKQY